MSTAPAPTATTSADEVIDLTTEPGPEPGTETPAKRVKTGADHHEQKIRTALARIWNDGDDACVLEAVREKLHRVPGHVADATLSLEFCQSAAEDGFHRIHTPVKSTSFWRYMYLEFFVRTAQETVYIRSFPNGCQDILVHGIIERGIEASFEMVDAIHTSGLEQAFADTPTPPKLAVRVRRRGTEVSLEFLATDEKTFAKLHETACAAVCAMWRASTVPDIAPMSVSFASSS